MKKLTAMLCIIVLVFAFSSIALAANTRTSGLYTYEIKGNGTLTITKYNWDRNDGDVFIPSMLDGYTVTSIGEKAFSREVFDKKGACTVRLPDTIVQIGEFAFQNSPITFIHIPKSVQMIGDGAFANCQNMLKFSVDENNHTFATIDNVIFHKQKKQLIAYPYANYNNGKYEIPEGIKSIAPYAFYWEHVKNGNLDLERSSHYAIYDISALKWPTTLIEIGDYAFYGCMVETIPLVDRIGNYSFSHGATWSMIKKDDIGNYASGKVAQIPYMETKEIGIGAFEQFNSAGTVQLVINATDVSSYAFSAIKNSIKLKNIENIGEGGFMSCVSIYGTFPATIKSIGPYAFTDTYIDIETIEIPSAVNEIGDYAFSLNYDNPSSPVKYYNRERNENLQTVIIQDGCTRVGNGAFEGHPQLSTVIFPDTITEIGENAFADCKKLSEVRLPASISKIGNNAFEKEYITLIVEPYSYAELWASENGYTIQGKTENTDWLNN